MRFAILSPPPHKKKGNCSDGWRSALRDASWNEGRTKQSQMQRVEHALAVFACSREIAADLAESVGAGFRAETA
jgi:hypothetical protein